MTNDDRKRIHKTTFNKVVKMYKGVERERMLNTLDKIEQDIVISKAKEQALHFLLSQ